MDVRATWIAPLALLFAFAAVALHLSFISTQDPDAREDARLRAHFARVERVLARRDLHALNPAQRAARAQALRNLHAYAAAGAFPRNRGESSSRTPIFVDRAGNRCAMACLIERSDRGDLVARIARTANLARIRDLSSDPELVAWLDSAGLTAAEAGLIQPGYEPFYRRDDPHEDNVPEDGVLWSGVVLGVTMGGPALYFNLHAADYTWQERKSHILLGGLMGTSLLTIGLVDWIQDGHMRGPGYFDLTAGALIGALSLRNVMTGPGPGSGRASGSGRESDRMRSSGQGPQTGSMHELGVRFDSQGNPQVVFATVF
jgi:hypothetical protein